MKLFLFIALIAIVAIVLISMQRSGPRITTIEHKRETEEDDRDA